MKSFSKISLDKLAAIYNFPLLFILLLIINTNGECKTDEGSDDLLITNIIIPICNAPPTVNILPIDLPADFPDDLELAYTSDFIGTSALMNNLFGIASGTGEGATTVDTIVELMPQINLNACGWGTIIRHFEAWQWQAEGDLNGNGILDREEALVSSNTCNQIITIGEYHDFIIDFPQDGIAYSDDDCIWDISISSQGADVIAVNKGEPLLLPATDDESFIMSITYDAINWCQWQGLDDGYTISRLTEENNTVESSERPVLFGNSDGTTIDRSNDIQTICPDGSGGMVPVDASNLPDSTSAQDPNRNLGRWVYTQYIKIYDTIAPLMIINQFGGGTDLCPDLEAGQFCTPAGSDAMVSIPFTASDIFTIMGRILDDNISIVSAQLDLFSTDLNEDGLINENEFMAESGTVGNVIENIMDNGDGSYLFSRACPIIPHEMRASVFHAIHIVLRDTYGNQVNKIIPFDVLEQEAPNTLDDLNLTDYSTILYQNQPNPFSSETTISFYLPKASETSIAFRDITGRLLYIHKGFYLAGLNEVKIDKSVFHQVSGLLTYTLTSGTFVTSRKMVVVE